MSDTGLGKLCAQLDKIAAELETAEYMKEAGQFVRSAAVLHAPKFSGYLQNNIFLDVESSDEGVTGTVYTDTSYAPYVEMGTGPKGAADHDGISPEVTPAYRMTPWWIHESDLDIGVAEFYHWPYIDTPEGRFYKCSGQPAQPFLYPALKDNEKEVLGIMQKEINKILERSVK